MLLTLSGVIDKGMLEALKRDISALPFHDGQRTAGPVARAVKANRQADLTTRLGHCVANQITDALKAHPVFIAAARPCRLSPPIVSRTEEGGAYGWHVDNPFMGKPGDLMRTDLAVTVFLSGETEYEGGALEIEERGLTHSLRGGAGDAVLYPATSLHRVAEVTRGVRMVAVVWVESRFRDEGARGTLFDLDTLRAELMKSHDPQSAEMLTLQKVIANLSRRWGET